MGYRIEIAGAKILITGGASGIGLALARGALSRGAERVIIWDLDEEAVERAVAQNPGLEGMSVDVSVPARVKEAAASIGEVDVVINSAGVVSGTDLLETSDAAIRRTFGVNTLALYWTTRAFLPGMLRRDSGTIVTLASAAGLVGVARQTDYSASKWAAVGFTESLRQELAKRKAHVNTLSVCPFYVSTGMFDGVTTKFPHLLPILKPEQVAQKILDGIEKGKQQLIMPPLVRLLPALRLLPVAGFDAVLNLFGINQTMDGFKGKTPQPQ